MSENEAIAIIILGCFLLVPVLFALIFWGEKWRMAYLQKRGPMPPIYDDSRIVYESQCPFWMDLFIIVIIAACCWLNMIAGCLIFALSFLTRGLYLRIDESSVKVYLGVLRLRMLTVPLDSIVALEVMTFRPILDFGGWGIRRGNEGIWGYFMSGNRGVLITTDKNKNQKYLLGSDYPDRLYELLLNKSRNGASRNDGPRLTPDD